MTFQRKLGLGLLLVFVTASLPVAGCSKAPDPWADVPGQGPKVLASFPPLYCFTKAVAGDHAQVLCLLTTQGPHGYSPDITDARKAKKADLFIINGLELDDFVVTIKNSSGNKKLRVVDIGHELKHDHKDVLIKVKHDHDHDHGDGHHHHHHGEYDPHLWLGIKEAKLMVEIIRDQLSLAAPEHKEAYAKNAEAYLKKLDELHEYGKKTLGDAKNQRIVATHDSLSYFARSFGVNVVDNLMPQPGIEADNKKLQELVKLCTDAKAPVAAITTEPQYGTKTAETLIKQIERELEKLKKQQPTTRAKAPALVTFDTLETAATPKFTENYYVTKMRENIDNLAKALK